jgi:hypothetical protein
MSDEPDDGGAAFPTEAVALTAADMHHLRLHMGWSARDAKRVLGHSPGMSLRDYFAGQALAGMLAGAAPVPSRAGSLAYGYADALLAARSARKETKT